MAVFKNDSASRRSDLHGSACVMKTSAGSLANPLGLLAVTSVHVCTRGSPSHVRTKAWYVTMSSRKATAAWISSTPWPWKKMLMTAHPRAYCWSRKTGECAGTR